LHTPPRRSGALDSTPDLSKPRNGSGSEYLGSPGATVGTSEFSTRAWNVDANWKSLPRVHPLYVLGTTRTTVRGGGSPADLARRICDVLRELSLDAVYDCARAKASVNSADRVEFFIRLFRDDTDVSSRSVTVEVQRKRGCTYRFHEYARSVMCAAADGTSSPGTARAASVRGRVGTVPAVLPEPVGADAEEYSVERALETAADLMRKDRIDANKMGMESVVLLTKAESSGVDRALYVSRVLLTDDTKEFGELKKIFMNLLVGSTDLDESDENDAFESRHNEDMYLLALTAMGNSLSVLATHAPGSLRSILNGQSWIGENGKLLSSLVGELGRAETHPHDACEAARCLRAVLMAAPELAQHRAKELGVSEKLMAAQRLGQCRHSMLEQESSAALAQVQL